MRLTMPVLTSVSKTSTIDSQIISLLKQRIDLCQSDGIAESVSDVFQYWLDEAAESDLDIDDLHLEKLCKFVVGVCRNEE